jgi:hypothetical protein
VLGDAAAFVSGNIGLAYRVEQGGLAMVDVTHHGDHGRARLQVGCLFADFQRFDLPGRGVNHAGPALALFQLE